MLDRTRRLWAKQDQHVGDREKLFSAVAEGVSAETVLYPGSYVDLAPSFVWSDVTYVDVDKRAMQFFGDRGDDALTGLGESLGDALAPLDEWARRWARGGRR